MQAKIVKRFYGSAFALLVAVFFSAISSSLLNGMGEHVGIDALGVFLLHGIIFTVAVLFVGGFLGFGSAFAKKARAAEGWAVPTAIGAGVMLFCAGLSFKAGIQSGLAFYLGPAPAVLTVAAGVIEAVKSASAFTQVLVGVGGAVLSFVGTFASKDADDEEGDPADVTTPPPEDCK